MMQQQRILGIDYGSRRIGIAVSDPMNIIARSVGVVINSPSMFDKIRTLVLEYAAVKIVVGMPYNLKGEKGSKAQEVEAFIDRLRQELSIEVVAADERFTSSTAMQTLVDMGVPKKQRQVKSKIDEMAAALILQGYLDSQ
jgi:putative Holliday junction resolvase